MKFVFLADRMDAIPIVANWYFEQWGHISQASAEMIADKLHGALHRDEIPLVVLAVDEDEVVGAAELKYREMAMFPNKEHWIGGVFVASNRRGKGIGAQIVNRVVEIATSLGVATLHLQTEKLDGGLYARLGWIPLEQVHSRGRDVLVMERRLHPGPRITP